MAGTQPFFVFKAAALSGLRPSHPLILLDMPSQLLQFQQVVLPALDHRPEHLCRFFLEDGLGYFGKMDDEWIIKEVVIVDH